MWETLDCGPVSLHVVIGQQLNTCSIYRTFSAVGTIGEEAGHVFRLLLQEFKILLITYKALSGEAPSYSTETLTSSPVLGLLVVISSP